MVRHEATTCQLIAACRADDLTQRLILVQGAEAAEKAAGAPRFAVPRFARLKRPATAKRGVSGRLFNCPRGLFAHSFAPWRLRVSSYVDTWLSCVARARVETPGVTCSTRGDRLGDDAHRPLEMTASTAALTRSVVP